MPPTTSTARAPVPHAGRRGCGLAALVVALAACAPPPGELSPGDLVHVELPPPDGAPPLEDPAAPPRVDIERLHEQYRALFAQWLAEPWARTNGYVYAVDVAQLLTYAAAVGDRQRYRVLRSFAERMIVDEGATSFTTGFVLWRWAPHDTLDASGTTETLRMAEGLWRGSEQLDLPAERDTAVTMVQGYGRHEYVSGGVWFIRNYYKFSNNSMATNSFLIDYDPDFIDEVADAREDAQLKLLATRSYEVVQRAKTPCGLLYTMIQPEVGTLMHPKLTFFSPNNVVRLSNTCTVAERALRRDKSLGRGVLQLALSRLGNLSKRLDATTCAAVDATPADLGAYTCLVRLAARLGDRQAAERLLPYFGAEARRYLGQPHGPRLYVLSEVLHTFLWLDALRGAASPGGA